MRAPREESRRRRGTCAAREDGREALRTEDEGPAAAAAAVGATGRGRRQNLAAIAGIAAWKEGAAAAAGVSAEQSSKAASTKRNRSRAMLEVRINRQHSLPFDI